MKKPYVKPASPEDWQKEYKELLQTDIEKAKEIKKKIDYLNYGIRTQINTY